MVKLDFEELGLLEYYSTNGHDAATDKKPLVVKTLGDYLVRQLDGQSILRLESSEADYERFERLINPLKTYISEQFSYNVMFTKPPVTNNHGIVLEKCFFEMMVLN